MGGAVTLVVADVHDGHVVLVADTMITDPDGDERATRHAFETGLPKLVILSPHLCAGYAGERARGSLQLLIGLRGAAFDDVVAAAAAADHAEFVVAAVDPEPRLVQIRRGVVDDVTALGRSWAGDPEGYSIFQEFRTPPNVHVDHIRAIRSAIQRVVAFPAGETVGGYDLAVVHGPDGFRFVPEPRVSGPERAEYTVHPDGRVELSVPPGEDDSFQVIGAAAGTGATPGALGFWHATSGLGIVYPHDRPWDPITARTATIDELVAVAAAHGQELLAAPVPRPTLAEFNDLINAPGNLVRVVPHQR